MALRILWDKFETALLIDTCLQIENGLVSRRDAIANLSKKLRERAVENGIEIDEIYRNENGITLQLMKVERLLQKNPDAKLHNSQLFIDMVDMYFADRTQFKAILSEAKGGRKPMKTNQELFVEWLSSRVSPSKLSDYYVVVSEIDSYAGKKRIYKGSLYDVSDPTVTAKLINALNEDRFFRYMHKREIKSIVEVATYYHKYTKEIVEHSATVPIEPSQATISTENTQLNHIFESPVSLNGQGIAIPQSASISTERSQLTEDTTEEATQSSQNHVPSMNEMKGSLLTVDFSEDAEYAFTKPVSVSYFGEEVQESSWRKIYIKTCEFLIGDYPNDFARLKRACVPGDRRSLIYGFDSFKRLTAPAKIADSYYIETNRSATDIVRNIKALLDTCRVDYENLIIKYIKDKQEIEQTISAQAPQPATGDSVLDYLTENGIEYLDLRDRMGCLWIIGGTEISDQIQTMRDSGITVFFKAGGGTATKGRSAYWTKDNTSGILITEQKKSFISGQGSPVAPEKPVAVTMQNTNGRNEFTAWLQSQNITSDQIRATLLAFSRIDEFALDYAIVNGSLYDVKNPIILKDVWDMLIRKSDFSRYRRNNSDCVYAYKQYLAFRRGEGNPITVPTQQRVEQPKPAVGSATQAVPDIDGIITRRRQAFMLWMEKQKYSTGTCNGYASAIASIDEFGKNHGLTKRSLYEIDSYEELAATWRVLLSSQQFSEYNREQHNRFSAAIRQYLAFRKETKGNESATTGSTYRVPVPATPVRQTPAPAVNYNTRQGGSHPGRVEFEQWMRSEGVPVGSAKTYADAVENIGKFLLQNGLEDRNIFAIRGASRLDRIRTNLSTSADYAHTCTSGGVQLDLYALKKYIGFRRNNTNGDIDDATVDKYSVILQEDFENGFRPGSMIDRNRFKQFYADRFGAPPAQNDEQIISILRQVGAMQDDRIFVREGTASNDLLDDILAEIARAFKAGATCVYFSEVYDRHQYKLASQLQIFSPEVMKDFLVDSCYGEYRTSKHYFYLPNRNPSADDDVRMFMQHSSLPMNYDSIHDQLWYIPMDTIKHCLVTTTSIVNVAQETYFYAPNLPISADELSNIGSLVHGLLEQKSFVTDAEMRALIEKHCPSVAINTEGFTTWGLRNCLAVLLGDRFAFNGAIISERGQAMNMDQVFKEFSRSHDVLTLDELKDFAKDVNNGIIYWESVMDVMVRISEDEMIPKGQIRFDLAATDAVLDEMTDGNYQPLKTYKLFFHYPPIGVRWNTYVLESYVASYSPSFMLLHASYTATDSCGAIVRRNSGIQDFQGLVLDVLAHSDGWQTKNDALTLLVDRGYLQRKHYTKIDAIIPEAKLLREKYLAGR